MNQEFADSAQCYKRLIDLVMNENNCDDLLPYQTLILNYFTAQVQHFDNLLKNSKSLERFTVESHKLEIERIKFLIHRYLEKRVKKIEQNASSLINLVKENREAAAKLMSTAEMSYLQK